MTIKYEFPTGEQDFDGEIYHYETYEFTPTNLEDALTDIIFDIYFKKATSDDNQIIKNCIKEFILDTDLDLETTFEDNLVDYYAITAQNEFYDNM